MSVSAFGVDHGISKAYGQIASRLATAAEQGHPYAIARQAAAQKAPTVQRAAQKPGMIRNVKANLAQRAGAAQKTKAAGIASAPGVGGVGLMESQAAGRISQGAKNATNASKANKSSGGKHKGKGFDYGRLKKPAAYVAGGTAVGGAAGVGVHQYRNRMTP